MNSYVIGAASYGYTSARFVLKKKVKEKIAKALAEKIGSKFVPGLNAASWVIDGYCLVTGAMGYRATKLTTYYDKWKIYKHQGGKWVAGTNYKVTKLKIRLVK